MNPQKKQMTKEQSQGLGCLLLIVIAVVIYASSNRDGTFTPSPTPNAPNFGQQIDVRDEWINIPSGVQFRSCPLLGCRVVATAGDNERAFITRFEAGEIVEGIELWVVANIDGTDVFAPMIYAMPPATPLAEVTP